MKRKHGADIYETTLNIWNEELQKDEEVDVKIEYVYYPGCPGSCDKYGQKIEPDEPANVEIQKITRKDNRQIVDIDELDCSEQDLETEIMENLE